MTLSFLRGHLVTRGELRSAQSEIATMVQGKSQEELLRFSDEKERILHPFAGYILSTNPIEKYVNAGSGGAIVVGITGGSVARHFALNERAARTFLLHLQAIPAFSGKEIVLVNLAGDGYKQPQQLQLLQYMLAIGATFDVFVELDGVNEIWHTHTNFVHNRASYLYPELWRSRMTMLRERLPRAYFDVMIDKRVAVASFMERFPVIRSSYTANALWAAVDGMIVRRTVEPLTYKESAMPNERPYEVYGPFHPDLPTWEMTEEKMVQLWTRSSKMMHNLATNNNFLYVHFLQPNQYAGVKPWSDKEKEVALVNPLFQDWFSTWYPRFRESGKQLQDEGVPFHDITMIFEHVPDTLYTDHCCHLNETGSTILGEAMADVIVQEWVKQHASVRQ